MAATIACKLPNGFTLTHKEKTVTFRGANAPDAVLGFGLTHGVDGEWFKDWATTDGKNFPAVKNGSLFAQDNADRARAASKERAKDVKTGLEPLDPAKPAPGVEMVPGTEPNKG